jgi:hypothetical protein
MTTQKKPKLYKIVSHEFGPLHGGSGTWFAPTKGKPGKWMPNVENVEACRRGYHLIPAKAIVDWLPTIGRTGLLCEAEGRGASDNDGDKTAFAQARIIKVIGLLDEVSMRLAAADMAERVLPIFYKVRPKDNRPALAIQAARDFALGKIDAAARAAARDAARDAAWDAARAAAGAAAGAAARAAAMAAARAAARDAAGDAARDAAGDAARAAAGAAARAAAWAAAWDAARDANAKIIIAQARKRLKEVGQ